MIRSAAISFALIVSSPAFSACMGAHRSLCAFAKQHSLTIISGYRPGATIAGTGSPSRHRYGKAIDARPPRGVSKSAIARAAQRRGFRAGIYCSGSRHIHIEIPRISGRTQTYYKGCRVRKVRNRR